MFVTIHNPNKLPTIDYRKVKPLQGDLKDLTDANYYKLKNVLEKRGFTAPLFLWPHNNEFYLMDGHQRHRVMTREDMQPYEVPYIIIEAENELDAKAQLLEITSQYGTITQEGFDMFIADLPEAEVYESVHFDALPLLGTISTVDEVEEDEAPEVSSDPPTSKLGEIYQLGRHRLMCGDSLNSHHLHDLYKSIIDANIVMVFTDPPYGVDYQSRVDESRNKGWGKIKNDDLKGEELQNFIAVSLLEYKELPLYVCCNWQSYIDFEEALGKPNSLIVWDKGSVGLGVGFRNQHEFILFYGKIDHNSESNVWSILRDNNYAHPTQKPISIPARAIKNSSKEHQAIFDPFGGSGSTLMACEQLDRTCYMMELEPKYCDVIRKRYVMYSNGGELPDNWEELTPEV